MRGALIGLRFFVFNTSIGSSMKKRRSINRVLYAISWREAIDGQLQERKRIQEELDGIFKNLKRLDPSSILKNNVTINEDQAILGTVY